MTRNDVKKYCGSFSSVVATEKTFPMDYLSYTVKGKKFAYFKTSEPEMWSFNIRVSEDRFLELTDQPGIKPSKYMARFHWITLSNVDAMDENYLKELILWSYQKSLSSLPQKIQAEVNAASD